MRRLSILCVLCLSFAAALATSATANAAVLIGDQTIESTLDSNSAGSAEAFPFSNSTAGTASSISVYIGSQNTARTLTAGLYSDSSGHPGALLASGSLAPKAGTWNTVSIASTAIGAGRAYWVAVLGNRGTVYFRDRNGGPCNSVSSYQTNLTSLASSWTSSVQWNTCPISAYVNGTGSATAAPANTAVPAISGTATQGQTLSTSNGTWTNSPSSYAYHWEDCSSSGGSCTSISGATSSSYTLASGDVNHTVRAVVTASNAGGSTSATSAQTALVSSPPPAAPVNTALPTISGTATQGQTLSTSNGTWSGSPTGYAYQWQDCNSSGASCTNVSGATSSSYTLTSADVGQTMRIVVTAANTAGSMAATSAATSPVAAPPPAAPSATAAPTMSGSTVQGQMLSSTNGTWTGSPTSYTYAWQDCDSSGNSCTNIAGASSRSYTLATGDVGHTMRLVVAASNAGGSGSSSSAATAMVTASTGGGGGGGGGGGNSVPCALTHAAGADPINSCWATHTGVLNGTGYSEAQIEAGAPGFTHVTHDVIITQPNTVIDHEWISGCIQIADGANNTTIKNTLVTPNGSSCSADNAGGSAINTGQGPSIAKNTLIEDTTVDGGNPGYGSHAAGITVDAGEVLRVNLFGFAQGFISDSNTAQYPALFQDDYGHGYIGCTHDDGTWFNSSSYVTMEHSYVLMGDPGGTDCTTGAFAGGSDYGPADHITYDNSYGGGADGEAIHTGCGSTYMTITNNAVDNATAKFGSDGGYQALTGNTWSGNYSVDHSTGGNLGSWGPFSASC
jgi:hypothetical protein